MVTENHTIIYEGLEMTVFGNWDSPDCTTGYKGGWSTVLIEVNGIDIIWMLKESVVNRISEIILNER